MQAQSALEAGQPTLFPADRDLNLPTEMFGLEVRQRVAFEDAPPHAKLVVQQIAARIQADEVIIAIIMASAARDRHCVDSQY